MTPVSAADEVCPRAGGAPLKVLMAGVNLVPASGGTFQTVRMISEAIRLNGCEVTTLNFSKHSPADTTMDAITFSTTHKPMGRAYQWCCDVYSDRVRNLVRGFDIVTIHGVYVHPLLETAKLADRYGLPFVVVPHGSLDPYSLRHHGYRKRAWLWLNRDVLFTRSAAVLYATEAERDRSWASGLERRVECMPWPAVAVGGINRAAAREKVRRRHGLNDRRIALFCARLARVKQPIETIRAFLREAPGDWVLLLAGPPTPEVPIDAIRALCAASGGRSIETGPIFRPEIEDYYAAADLFLLLSASENYGHSLAQALANGVPVVVSPGVGLAGYVRRFGGGFVAESAAFEDLCSALRTAFHHSPESLRRQGEAGRRWVARELNLDGFRRHFADMCASICSARSRG